MALTARRRSCFRGAREVGGYIDVSLSLKCANVTRFCREAKAMEALIARQDICAEAHEE